MRVNKNFRLWQVGDEYMIVKRTSDNLNLSDIYLFNETSAFMFKEVEDKEFDTIYLKDILCQEYDVDVERAQKDVNLFVETMIRYGFFIN